MKKLLFALLMLLSAAVFVPKAEAGQYARVWTGHGYTYVHKSQLYGYGGYGGYYSPRHRSSHYRPVRGYYYSRPVRYYRSYDYCERPVRYYSSRPRVAISFGF